MAPFVNLQLDVGRLGATGVQRDHNLGAPLGQVGDNRVGIESFVGDQTAELDAFDQRGHSRGVETLARLLVFLFRKEHLPFAPASKHNISLPNQYNILSA